MLQTLARTATILLLAWGLRVEQKPVPSNVLLRDDIMAPASLEEMWQRSKVVALIQIVSTEQKAFPVNSGSPFPTPYLRHGAKILRLWKSDGHSRLDKEIWISYRAGTVVHRGTTIVVESDVVLATGDQAVAFLSDYPAAASYAFTFGPASALIVEERLGRARLTKLLTAYAFRGQSSLASSDLFRALDGLSRGGRN